MQKDDVIYRQAAIDALRCMQTYKLFAGDDLLLIDQAGAQTELMCLPSAQPEPQWIPMSEREPEFGNYLTTFREKATGKVDVAIDLYWSGGWDDDGNGKFETLAWMPLPAPWRGEGHGE